MFRDIHQVTPLPEHFEEVRIGSYPGPGHGEDICYRSSTCYVPQVATVLKDGTVTWFNDSVRASDGSEVPYKLVSGTPEDGPDGIFESPNIVPGETWSMTFPTVGKFHYYDEFDDRKIGQVIVFGKKIPGEPKDPNEDNPPKDPPPKDPPENPGDNPSKGESEKAQQTPKSLPKSVDVDMAPGSGATTECQATNECYLPPNAAITIGGTVTWKNVDTAPHTVTSGTPKSGPSGEFDSSLVMVGGDFSHKFEDAGKYDYYCMVHPWMQGTVKVIP